MLPFKFFFLIRLPPLFELPRTHSRPSRLHRSHGGEPPDASLVHESAWMHTLWLAVQAAWKSSVTSTYRSHLLFVSLVWLRAQICGEKTYLSLTTEDACPRDSLHGRRRAILSHNKMPLPLNCRRRLRVRDEQHSRSLSRYSPSFLRSSPLSTPPLVLATKASAKRDSGGLRDAEKSCRASHYLSLKLHTTGADMRISERVSSF